MFYRYYCRTCVRNTAYAVNPTESGAGGIHKLSSFDCIVSPMIDKRRVVSKSAAEDTLFSTCLTSRELNIAQLFSLLRLQVPLGEDTVDEDGAVLSLTRLHEQSAARSAHCRQVNTYMATYLWVRMPACCSHKFFCQHGFVCSLEVLQKTLTLAPSVSLLDHHPLWPTLISNIHLWHLHRDARTRADPDVHRDITTNSAGRTTPPSMLMGRQSTAGRQGTHGKPRLASALSQECLRQGSEPGPNGFALFEASPAY
jgi:hypothetical protein